MADNYLMCTKLDTDCSPFLRALYGTQDKVYGNYLDPVSHFKDFSITQSKVTCQNDLLRVCFMQALEEIRHNQSTAVTWRNYQSGEG